MEYWVEYDNDTDVDWEEVPDGTRFSAEIDGYLYEGIVMHEGDVDCAYLKQNGMNGGGKKHPDYKYSWHVDSSVTNIVFMCEREPDCVDEDGIEELISGQ